MGVSQKDIYVSFGVGFVIFWYCEWCEISFFKYSCLFSGDVPSLTLIREFYGNGGVIKDNDKKEV